MHQQVKVFWYVNQNFLRFCLYLLFTATTMAAAAQTRIVFSSYRDNNFFHIYVMNSDGTNEARLTNVGGGDVYPGFSPDGSKIVFTSSRDGNYEIYVMNADGTGQTNLAILRDLLTVAPEVWQMKGQWHFLRGVMRLFQRFILTGFFFQNFKQGL